MNNLSIMNFAILNNKVRRGDSPPLILSYLILSYLILSVQIKIHFIASQCVKHKEKI